MSNFTNCGRFGSGTYAYRPYDDGEGVPPGEARRHTDSHGGSDQSELRSL